MRAKARLLHHEAPVLSSVWTGDHSRGAGRPAAGRLALQTLLPALFSLPLRLFHLTHVHPLSLFICMIACLPPASHCSTC